MIASTYNSDTALTFTIYRNLRVISDFLHQVYIIDNNSDATVQVRQFSISVLRYFYWVLIEHI